MPGGARRRLPDRLRAAAPCCATGILVALAAAGCGGGGGTSSAETTSSVGPGGTASTSTVHAQTGSAQPGVLGSARAVRTAADAVLASSDPDGACGRYVTQRFLRTAYGDREGCVRAQQPGSAARSLSSFRIEHESGQAQLVSASAIPRGGPYGGANVTIGLVFAGDHYRVDRLSSNVPVGP